MTPEHFKTFPFNFDKFLFHHDLATNSVPYPHETCQPQDSLSTACPMYPLPPVGDVEGRLLAISQRDASPISQQWPGDGGLAWCRFPWYDRFRQMGGQHISDGDAAKYFARTLTGYDIFSRASTRRMRTDKFASTERYEGDGYTYNGVTFLEMRRYTVAKLGWSFEQFAEMLNVIAPLHIPPNERHKRSRAGSSTPVARTTLPTSTSPAIQVHSGNASREGHDLGSASSILLPNCQNATSVPFLPTTNSLHGDLQTGTSSTVLPPRLSPFPSTISDFHASALANAAPDNSGSLAVLPRLVGGSRAAREATGKSLLNPRYVEAIAAKTKALRGHALKADDAESLRADLARTESSARSGAVRSAGTRRMMAKLLKSAEEAGLSVPPDVEKAVQTFCNTMGFSDDKDTHHMFGSLEARSGKDGPEMAMMNALGESSVFTPLVLRCSAVYRNHLRVVISSAKRQDSGTNPIEILSDGEEAGCIEKAGRSSDLFVLDKPPPASAPAALPLAKRTTIDAIPFPPLDEEVTPRPDPEPDRRLCKPKTKVGPIFKRRMRKSSRLGHRSRRYALTDLATVAWHTGFLNNSRSAENDAGMEKAGFSMPIAKSVSKACLYADGTGGGVTDIPRPTFFELQASASNFLSSRADVDYNGGPEQFLIDIIISPGTKFNRYRTWNIPTSRLAGTKRAEEGIDDFIANRAKECPESTGTEHAL